MNFAIVEFVNSAEVDVVCTSWIKGSVCLWPPVIKSERVKQCVLKQEKPQDTWIEYNVRIISLFETYAEARKKLPMATVTSDLASDADNRGKGKRLRKKRKLSSSSEASTSTTCTVEEISNIVPPSPPLPDTNSLFLCTADYRKQVPVMARSSMQSSRKEETFLDPIIASTSNTDLDNLTTKDGSLSEMRFSKSVFRELELLKEIAKNQNDMLYKIYEELKREKPGNENFTNSTRVKEALAMLPLTSLQGLHLFEKVDPDILDAVVILF